MVMSSYHGSIQKGIESDVVVRRPAHIVKALVKARLLPRDAFVKVVDLPDGKMRRSALFGVTFFDLSKRQEAIENHVDDAAAEDLKKGYGISPLEGKQTFALLVEAVGHAHLAEPTLIDTDPVLQGFCSVFGEPAVYTALTQGGASAIADLVHLIQGSN